MKLPKVGEIFVRRQESVDAGAPRSKVVVTLLSKAVNDSKQEIDVVHFKNITADFINVLPAAFFHAEFEKQKHYILFKLPINGERQIITVADTAGQCAETWGKQVIDHGSYEILEWEEGNSFPADKKFDCQTGKQIENKKNFEVTVILQKKFIVKETTKETAVNCALYEMKGHLKSIMFGSFENLKDSPLVDLYIEEK